MDVFYSGRLVRRGRGLSSTMRHNPGIFPAKQGPQSCFEGATRTTWLPG